MIITELETDAIAGELYRYKLCHSSDFRRKPWHELAEDIEFITNNILPGKSLKSKGETLSRYCFGYSKAKPTPIRSKTTTNILLNFIQKDDFFSDFILKISGVDQNTRAALSLYEYFFGHALEPSDLKRHEPQLSLQFETEMSGNHTLIQVDFVHDHIIFIDIMLLSGSSIKERSTGYGISVKDSVHSFLTMTKDVYTLSAKRQQLELVFSTVDNEFSALFCIDFTKRKPLVTDQNLCLKNIEKDQEKLKLIANKTFKALTKSMASNTIFFTKSQGTMLEKIQAKGNKRQGKKEFSGGASSHHATISGMIFKTDDKIIEAIAHLEIDPDAFLDALRQLSDINHQYHRSGVTALHVLLGIGADQQARDFIAENENTIDFTLADQSGRLAWQCYMGRARYIGIEENFAEELVLRTKSQQISKHILDGPS